MNMLFGSSPSSSGRIETMKSAEIALISFTHRFLGIYSFSNSNDNNESKLVALANNSTTSTPDSKTTTFKKYQSETHTLEVFDTKIPRSSVPLRQPKSMFQRENEVTDHFTIHGVKVTSHSYDKTHTTKEAEEPPLVLLHGYMNGSLYFYRNLLGLSNFIGPQVYSLDCLGWGLSSRPKFSLETGSTTTSSKTTNNNDHDHESYTTEQVYVESLEAWRKSHCINKMILGGHSIGGLFACAYAEKYPENVERLILISPAGVPDDKEIDMEARLKDRPLRFKMMFGVAKGLWNLGVNPSSFLRNLPESTGRRWVRNYIEGRLPAITCPEEKKHLGEYLYTNAALPGSGEHSLNKVLKPTSFAKKPGVHRIPQLKVNNVEFIYGQTDWMDASGGIQVMDTSQRMKKQGQTAPDVQVYGVSNAGHLLMLENWKEFNAAMIHAAGLGHRLPTEAPNPFKVVDTQLNSFFKDGRLRKEDQASS